MSGAGQDAGGVGGEVFWRLVGPELASGTLERGTTLGCPCVRARGEFVGMPHSATGALVVKLREARVRKLVEEGRGRPFAPAGRVFKEWMQVPEIDEALWRALLAEALTTAGGEA